MKVNLQLFNELLSIQKERQLALQELSEILGYDISFSDEEVLQFAEEAYEKAIIEGIETWMKSVYS
jgi:hypothetical protein